MTTDFPQAALDALVPFMTRIDGIKTVVQRPVDQKDGSETLGIFVLGWEPIEYEMIGSNLPMPSLTEHEIFLQYVVKSTDEIAARQKYRKVAKSLRLMLYRDESLRDSFGQLVDQDPSGILERVRNWKVRRQRFASDEIEGDFVYMSVTELVLTTEVINAF